MSIYLNKDSKVIVQGITGGEGTKHTALMLKAGTRVVGGVNARKAGTTVAHTDKDGNPGQFGPMMRVVPFAFAYAHDSAVSPTGTPSVITTSGLAGG
ncbi:CoA binding domain-containing protein [Microbacterium saccharophilum]|uniref:CoA binding domain-containing protein n=1 Tax=Microbacterium saccharophilum TaxID=1213358 RepID=A0A7Z7GDL4_9MICO|nr:CoA binding domain-containing protein [Microbacterium saccharophilum]